ncbi:hypothetical protein AAVH_35026 [Aphelenchoides avenae]|nr:hypothetical protein AAVH_35026 [Aphelenchus avenae]
MLPNESLLVVLYFVDYRTLVLAKLAGAPFLRLAIRFTNELARRRRFCVTFFSSWITYEEAPMGARRSIRYERGNQPSLLSACRELNGVAGPHAVDKVMFSENTWNIPYVDVVFEAASPLKHAEDVLLNSRAGSATVPNFEAFTSNFAGMKTLRLWLDCDVFDGFSWAFLRQESARGLRLLKVSYKDSWATRADVRSSVEELVGCCGTLPHLHGGEALVLDFSENHVSSGLVLRIIEVSARMPYRFSAGNP